MKNIKIIALLVMTLVVVLACFTSCETLQQIPGINQIPGIKHEHSYTEGKCECGAEDPDYHVHSYEAVVTAPACTVAIPIQRMRRSLPLLSRLIL